VATSIWPRLAGLCRADARGAFRRAAAYEHRGRLRAAPDTRPLTKFEQRGLRLGHGVWDCCSPALGTPGSNQHARHAAMMLRMDVLALIKSASRCLPSSTRSASFRFSSSPPEATRWHKARGGAHRGADGAGVLTLFIFAGEPLLVFFGIRLAAFSVAGGLLLLLLALVDGGGARQPATADRGRGAGSGREGFARRGACWACRCWRGRARSPCDRCIGRGAGRCIAPGPVADSWWRWSPCRLAGVSWPRR